MSMSDACSIRSGSNLSVEMSRQRTRLALPCDLVNAVAQPNSTRREMATNGH
jgi:hypothetical protein